MFSSLHGLVGFRCVLILLRKIINKKNTKLFKVHIKKNYLIPKIFYFCFFDLLSNKATYSCPKFTANVLNVSLYY